jgi:hypothetical protein
MERGAVVSDLPRSEPHPPGLPHRVHEGTGRGAAPTLGANAIDDQEAIVVRTLGVWASALSMSMANDHGKLVDSQDRVNYKRDHLWLAPVALRVGSSRGPLRLVRDRANRSKGPAALQRAGDFHAFGSSGLKDSAIQTASGEDIPCSVFRPLPGR